MLSDTSINRHPRVLFANFHHVLKRNILKTGNFRWRKERTCASTRRVWSECSEDLISLSRPSVKKVIGAITRHWLGSKHAKCLGLIVYHDHCRTCHIVDEEEAMFHLLCHRPAFAVRRWTYLCQSLLNDLSDLVFVDVKAFLLFLNSSKSFMEKWPGKGQPFCELK